MFIQQLSSEGRFYQAGNFSEAIALGLCWFGRDVFDVAVRLSQIALSYDPVVSFDGRLAYRGDSVGTGDHGRAAVDFSLGIFFSAFGAW